MKALLRFVVPAPFVTAIVARPAVPLGVMKLRAVSLEMLTPVADDPPTVTAVAPVKFDPVKVTVVPPVELPLTGDNEVMTGAVVNVRAYSNLLGDPVPGLDTTLEVAAVVRALTTWLGVAVGFRPKYTAAAPATCGDAIEVPLIVLVDAEPVFHVDVIEAPGAKISTAVP